MKYTNEDRKKLIEKYFALNTKICDCCYRQIKFDSMWLVKRYNHKGQFDNWYYCTSCFESKDELLIEIDTDSYPYGIYPIDFVFKKDKDSWARSLSDIHRKPNVLLKPKNLSKKRIKKLGK